MRVLLVCLRFPYPPADGGTIAMYNMAMALHKAGAEVKIVALNTKKHFVDLSKIPTWFMEKFTPEAVYLDATVTLLPAVKNLFASDSYNISRFDIPEFHFLLEGVLKNENFDVVQLESLFVTPYINTIRKFSDAKIIYRSHNVEYIIWERLAAATSNKLKKRYLNFLTERLKKYETSVISKFDALLTLTEDDHKLYQLMGNKRPVKVLPIGLDISSYPVSDQQNHNVFHLGSMDWLPNKEGIYWFLENIYPNVLLANATIKIHLAGKEMPAPVFNMQSDNLKVTGKIDDAKEFMRDKQIMIVPLLSGGGMRVKIIEGLAMGKTIISTTIGAEGTGYTHEKNMLIADTPEKFCDAILKCVTDPDFCNRIGFNARKLAEEKYDNFILGQEILHFYSSVKKIELF